MPLTLAQLVRQLDGGGALDVSGIPDAFLRSRLQHLFDNLVQLRKNSVVRPGCVHGLWRNGRRALELLCNEECGARWHAVCLNLHPRGAVSTQAALLLMPLKP